MNEPIRYDVGCPDCSMEKSEDGDYVEYEVYKKLLEEYNVVKGQLDLLHLAERACHA